MKLKSAIAALFAAALSCAQANAAATLLPNGEQCFSAVTGVNGMVGLLGSITGGSLYTTGTYGGVSLTGGSGSGATANITVAGGAVTAVTVLNPGTQYVVGDVLTAAAANIGGTGSGFSVPVASTAINSSLAGGTVGFFIPNTGTIKQTWFNADQTAAHQNTNPVTLDANGCAVIYGVGSYRQVLKDSLGNTVWDKITTDTSANNNTFWAGTAAGTPNAITVVDPGFNGTDGSVIQFIPVFSNTGPATLNPSGFGAISIVKDTTTGAVALAGGEIVANSPSNVVTVVYSASQANFHILNLVNQSAAQTPQTLCGAIGLKITNDGSLPNSRMNITAGQITMVSANLTISRSNPSLSVNLTTSGANGLDTGSVAASTTYYFYAIDNGSATAALASISSTAPTMPSGYAYKCRLGTGTTDGSSNLLRTIQLGSWVQYNGTNSGTQFLATAGGGSACSGAVVWATVSYPAFVPPTVTEVRVNAVSTTTGASPQNVAGAPNTSYTGPSSGKPAPVFALGTALSLGLTSWAQWVVEGSTFAYCATGTQGALQLLGYKDSVNAN